MKALILHCWYGKPGDNWYPWLSKELERRQYQVYIPELPTMSTALPELKAQLEAISQTVKADSDSLVIGHSLGGVLALRIAEKMPVRKMILVSGWDYDDLHEPHRKYWQTKINHSRIKSNCSDITCVSSDNDPYVTAFQAEEMSKRLNAKFLLIKGAGHFTAKNDKITKIPELLNYL